MTLRVDGRTVAVHQAGDPSGTPVLYLHGSGSSRLEVDLYDETARRHGVRMIAWDRPGCGGSSPLPGRSMRDVAIDARAVLASIGVAKAPVIGLSGGGSHVLALAATAPSLVTTAVAVNPGGPGEKWLVDQLPLRVRVVARAAKDRPRLFAMLAKQPEKLGKDFEKSMRNPLTARAMDKTDLAVLREPKVMRAFSAATKEGSRQPGAWATEAQLFWRDPWPFDPTQPLVPLHVSAAVSDPYRAFAKHLAAHGAVLHDFPGGHASGFADPVLERVVRTAIS